MLIEDVNHTEILEEIYFVANICIQDWSAVIYVIKQSMGTAFVAIIMRT